MIHLPLTIFLHVLENEDAHQPSAFQWGHCPSGVSETYAFKKRKVTIISQGKSLKSQVELKKKYTVTASTPSRLSSSCLA